MLNTNPLYYTLCIEIYELFPKPGKVLLIKLNIDAMAKWWSLPTRQKNEQKKKKESGRENC